MVDILVIGLAGRGPRDDWPLLLGARAVHARHADMARAALPRGVSIAVAYDDMIERVAPQHVASAIAESLYTAAADGPIAYLTPAFAALGDAVVDRLRARGTPRIAPGALSAANLPSGPVTVIDALDIAAAEAAEPFAGDVPCLDATTSLLVTNWHGDRVTSLAGRRIQRTRALDRIPAPDASGCVMIDAKNPLDATTSLSALTHIVARLRRADGCPWDREQTAQSLLPALAEEADELRQAIEAGNPQDTLEEIGDVLVNLLMQAQIATEAGDYRFTDAIAAVAAKLVRRHPHVFGAASATTADEVLAIWRRVKDDEKSGRI